MSRAFNDVSSAGTLAMSQHRLDSRWRTSFGNAVATHAQSLGLSVRRYESRRIAPGAIAAAVGVIALTYSITRGTDVADRRLVEVAGRSRVAVLVAVVALALATYNRAIASDQKPTAAGTRAGERMDGVPAQAARPDPVRGDRARCRRRNSRRWRWRA